MNNEIFKKNKGKMNDIILLAKERVLLRKQKKYSEADAIKQKIVDVNSDININDYGDEKTMLVFPYSLAGTYGYYLMIK